MSEKKEIVAYKGFNRDWKCRDLQYEVGKTYEHDGPVSRCNGGFHSCEYPLDVFSYYCPSQSRYAIVRPAGEIDREEDGDTKIASAKITVEAEINVPELIEAAIKWVTDQCKKVKSNHVKGYRSASSATGYRSASSATGNQSASSATGNRSASSATGYRSASSATGDRSASLNTGWRGKSLALKKDSGSVAVATGEGGVAQAEHGCAIVLVNRNEDGSIRHIRAAKIGECGINPNTPYTLNDQGEFEEVVA